MGQIYSNVVCSFEKATTEIRVFSKEYIGINSVIFNTCWVLFGNLFKELPNNLLLGKDTHGLRVNLQGPTQRRRKQIEMKGWGLDISKTLKSKIKNEKRSLVMAMCNFAKKRGWAKPPLPPPPPTNPVSDAYATWAKMQVKKITMQPLSEINCCVITTIVVSARS